MRLLIVGTLKGQLTTATRMAMERGAKVMHAETLDGALATLPKVAVDAWSCR